MTARATNQPPGRLARALRSRARAVPPIVAAVAVLALPCDCPDHAGHRGGPIVAAAGGGAAAHQGHAAPASSAARGAHPASLLGHAGDESAFEVGTATRPLITRDDRGPLWATSAPLTPGRTGHGTFAERTVAEQLERLRRGPGADTEADAAKDPVAARAAVTTTREATKQLSTACQRLIRADRSDLSRRQKARRLACVRKRRAIVQRSIAANAPGVSAPAAPIQGPAPTTAPPTPTTQLPVPAPTTPAPTSPTPTTPAKRYAAAGVIAKDGDVPFALTRSSATADIVNFELDNTDRQDHDLYIAPADTSGEITGAPVKIIGRIAAGTRASADVELAPGVYKLICTVPGHGPMAVKFTVFAPPAT